MNKGREKDGKPVNNSYYICNVDEPYAEIVHGVIVAEEQYKVQRVN
jgi:hypothetical protein